MCFIKNFCLNIILKWFSSFFVNQITCYYFKKAHNIQHSNKSSPKPAVVHDSYPWEQNVKVTNKNIGLAGLMVLKLVGRCNCVADECSLM